jgi:diguanylate cyclase (GGDEF)-like protein
VRLEVRCRPIEADELQTVLTRIETLRDRMNSMILPDREFGAEITGILAELGRRGVELRISVLRRENGEELVSYRSVTGTHENRQAHYRNQQPQRDRAAESAVEVWYGAGWKMPPGFEDLVNSLAALTNGHWGDRDPMTLLPYFKMAATEARILGYAARLARQASSVAVAHLDLDKFKDVNTDFGEPVGDAVLAEFGNRLREQFAEDGVVFRKGGEEFSLIIPGEPAALFSRLEAFRKRMEIEPFEKLARANTCSIGLAIYEAGDLAAKTSRFDDLSADAQLAERRAKTDGRNCIRLPSTKASEPVLEAGELGRAAIESRLNLAEAEACMSDPLAEALTDILSREIGDTEVETTRGVAAEVARRFGLQFGDPTRNGGPLEPRIPVARWAAVVARAYMRPTFRTGRPLPPSSELSFQTSGRDASGLSNLYLDIATGSVRQQILIACGLEVAGEALSWAIGRPWFAHRIAPEGGIARWASPGGDKASLLPVLLLPIGDTAIALAKQERDIVADVVEIDDRPVVGGGLPDFWQSNVARVVRACLRNPNIATIVVLGKTENASATLAQLRLKDVQWGRQVYDLQRRLSISLENLQIFRDRRIQVVCIEEASSEKLLYEVRNAIDRLQPGGQLGMAVDLEAEARSRRLPLSQPSESGRLSLADGLRTSTMAYAYPQAINLLRSSDAPPQTEATQRQFREFPSFKLVLTNPFTETIPDYWKSEVSTLEQYFQANFVAQSGLFGHPLQHVPAGHEPLYVQAIDATVNALKESRPTRRVMLPVYSSSDRFDQPLGLCAIHVMPRLRDGRWNLDFQWIWRTVEALVGFPFSAYGSITWSKRFFEDIERRMQTVAPAVPVQLGELTYLALSFHMFLDAGDMEIARAIVQDASR